MTSIYKRLPLVLTDAMSRGCVSVAFDSFNLVHDIINSGKNEILIRPFIIIDYHKSLTRLVQDEHQFKLMFAAAKDAIRNLILKQLVING